MRSRITLTILCVAFAPVRPAQAETLRCGSALIQPGDDAAYVLEKCGVPNQPPAAVVMRERSAGFYPYGLLRTDRWRYQRGPGKFPVVLTIGDDGRVQSVEFEKHRE